MAKLKMWRIGEPGAMPQRVVGSSIGLEKNFEDSIVNDVTLIEEGLAIVGRQMTIDEGRLDLLAIDSQDRWVVIEIKAGRLDSSALTQALGYASSIARLDKTTLLEKVEYCIGPFNEGGALLERVKQQLENEGDQREVAVLLVGAGVYPRLDRIKDFLDRYGLPIRLVSFGVFKLDDGPKLLVREDDDVIQRPGPVIDWRVKLEKVRQLAKIEGVLEPFDRFWKMSLKAGLAVQPYSISVRIAPPTNRTRFLMYARPQNGNLTISTGPQAFAEFFPPLTEEDATDALGKYEEGGFLAGAALDARLDQIEKFLTEKLPRTDVSGDHA